MLRGRRVGTFTAGLVLVIFGMLFLLRGILPNMNYGEIVSLWPIILILLGVEIIISYIVNKEEKIKYDAGAVVIVMILSAFSMVMAFMEFIIEHPGQFGIAIR